MSNTARCHKNENGLKYRGKKKKKVTLVKGRIFNFISYLSRSWVPPGFKAMKLDIREVFALESIPLLGT